LLRGEEMDGKGEEKRTVREGEVWPPF